jgi:hypothetical protein
MPDKATGFEAFYQKMSQWIEDSKQHEITKIVELVETAKAYLSAAESLPELRVKQFFDNFQYDLNEFYQQYQTQMQHSVYLGLLNETFWAKLAQMTDQAQVEWTEIGDDFEHDGVYQTGDLIGFGKLECQQCGNTQLIFHPSEVADCQQCAGKAFVRRSLTP